MLVQSQPEASHLTPLSHCAVAPVTPGNVGREEENFVRGKQPESVRPGQVPGGAAQEGSLL